MKSNYYLSIILICSSISQTRQVTLPNWYGQARNYLKEFNGANGIFNEEINWSRKWERYIQNLTDQLANINSMRKQVLACIPSGFEAKDLEIQACNATHAERDAIIAQLSNAIIVFEQNIATLTTNINQLNIDIQNLKLAIATILDLQEDKVDEVEETINNMKKKMNEMSIERDLFRIYLQEYYQQLAAYHYNTSQEDTNFAHDFCGSDFSFQEEGA